MGGYSLPLKNRDMFRDLKKGFQVYTLDTSDVPVFRMGNVVNVSSVTSSMVPSRICAGDAGVVTTEEQTPMTRIISGI